MILKWGIYGIIKIGVENMTYRIQKVHDLINETDMAWNMFLNYLQSSNYFKTFNIIVKVLIFFVI